MRQRVTRSRFSRPPTLPGPVDPGGDFDPPAFALPYWLTFNSSTNDLEGENKIVHDPTVPPYQTT